MRYRPTTTSELHIEELLKEAFIVLRLYMLYPSDHPIPRESLTRFYNNLKTYFRSHEVLEFEITKEKILFAQKPIGEKNEQLRNLAFHFFSRHISGLQIKKEVTIQELEKFISILSSNYEEISHQGGFKELTSKCGIKNIQVTEFEIKTSETGYKFDQVLPFFSDRDLSADELYNLLKKTSIEPFEQRKIILLIQSSPIKLSSLLSQLSMKASVEAKDYSVEYRASYLFQAINKFHLFIRKESKSCQERCYQNLANAHLQLENHLKEELFNKWILPDLKKPESLARTLLSYLTDAQLTDIVLSQVTKGKTAKKILEQIEIILLSKQRPGFIAQLKERLTQTGLDDSNLLAMLETKSYTRINASLSGTSLDEEFLQFPLHFSAPKLSEEEYHKLCKEVRLQAREASLENHFNSVLIKILKDEDTQERQKEIGQLIKNNISSALLEKGYRKAHYLLSSLNKLKTAHQATSYLKGMAALIIEEISTRFAPKLTATICEINNPEDEFFILECLKIMGSYAAESLVDALAEEQDMAKRKIICNALENLTNEYLHVIAAKMDTQKWYVVRNIVSILGRSENPKALEYFSKTISHPDSRVRSETVTALTGFKVKKATEILLQALQDPDIKIACKAVKQLGARKAIEATEDLIRIVKKFDPLFKLLDLKVNAIESLARLGSPKILPLLRKCSRCIGLFKPTKAHVMREAAKKAISTLETSLRHGGQNVDSS